MRRTRYIFYTIATVHSRYSVKKYGSITFNITHLDAPFPQHDRFRQEYRLERKLLNDLSIDPESFPVENEEFSALVASSAAHVSCGGRQRRISRVVVLHNDKLETFYGSDDDHVKQEELVASNSDTGADHFFDNDSFWSGSITWY